ncbi:unnamed protein product, partial [Brassica oleracea]
KFLSFAVQIKPHQTFGSLIFLFVAPISLIYFTDKPHWFLILASRFTGKLLMEG